MVDRTRRTRRRRRRVAVTPEARGTGVGRALLKTLLRNARDRAPPSARCSPPPPPPTAPAAGRSPDSSAPSTCPPPPCPGTPRPTAELHRRVAHHRNGLLTRTHPRFTATDELPYDGLTLVEHDGHLLGYAGWDRGRGYGPDAVLTVEDILATTADAARALVGVLASWHSVTPTLRLAPLPGDTISTHLPLERAREHERDAWMHRPVDVVRAVQTRGWPTHTHGQVTFTLTDDLADWNTGTWRLTVADGHADLHHTTDDADLHLTVRGFARLYTGTATARTLAETGLLHHTTPDPSALDLLAAGPTAHLIDYF